MTEEDLIKFLKENLKVKVNRVRPLCTVEYLKVELYLGNERIDLDEVRIN